MAKVKTHPWDPADHIVDGEHVLAYLHVITKEEYDPYVTPYFLDCITRSRGVAEIASLVCHESGDGNRSVTITTISGAKETIALAPEVDVDSIRRALTPAPAPAPASP